MPEQPARHQPGQPLRERPGVDRLVAVEHARLVVEQVGDVVAERLVLVAEFCQCDDALVTRVDLEDRLGRRIEPAGGVEQPLELPVGAVLRRDEADRALVRRCDSFTSDTASPSDVFTKARKVATCEVDASSGFFSPSGSGISVRSAAPCVTDLSGLPSNCGAPITQKLSTGSVSRITSTPRARKPSSCGEASSRARSSPAM